MLNLWGLFASSTFLLSHILGGLLARLLVSALIAIS